MPELPEVEITKQGIRNRIFQKKLNKIVIRNNRLRWPIDNNTDEILKERIVLDCTRRSKYILIHFEHGIQFIHLGMSGSLQFSYLDKPLEKHDHVEWIFEEFALRLNDPRRFGAVIWHPYENGPIELHPLINKLGIEPFSNDFTGEYLYNKFKINNTNIKQALLNGKIVVGIGNIYASEILFKSRINPFLKTKYLSINQCEELAQIIIETLNEAIASGGSSIKNFVDSNGKQGSYIEKYAYVYNREGKQCKICKKNDIIKIYQNNRSTYYCPLCQD
ncbi:formamidopyrimidine-DNA glycosylase [Candidatus Kinetoplastibacterium desouzaii TCC079E]|uniref:Formamidopyrimidine-DNA glycosylase n=1 Tax=Candidatus Kinetoplastidibacterium desouzai TCC079E TaxID=1208919 RepID=M1L1K9_9PROT|nr:bifunctional DNA-formamidopyrimidine glycosylase/DNA-(apurinic or apyrimidinic site) lyase [Candidatus Kinetoplastibacterium desouzaii]AGF46653.1 formamidopyrimidine-DNA glycosylase [Candidatus Kinetoplastibacterium desouzaii TCC079E]